MTREPSDPDAREPGYAASPADPRDAALDAALAGMRADVPDPPPVAWREALLVEFDAERARRAPRRTGLLATSSVLAAAALLAVAFLLARVPDSGVADDPAIARVQAVLNGFDRRLDALRTRVEALPRPKDAAPRTPEEDPAFGRLVSARAFEPIDPEGAVRRYRAVLTDFPEGPARAVARDRLEVLERAR